MAASTLQAVRYPVSFGPGKCGLITSTVCVGDLHYRRGLVDVDAPPLWRPSPYVGVVAGGEGVGFALAGAGAEHLSRALVQVKVFPATNLRTRRSVSHILCIDGD
jgi:hypothetical protein